MISTGGRARSRDLSASPTMPMMSPQWVEMAGFARIWSTKRASSTAVMVWVPPTGTMAVSASDEIRVSRVVDLRRADGESETDQAAGLGMERLGHVVRPGGLCGDPPDSYPVPRFKGAKVTLKGPPTVSGVESFRSLSRSSGRKWSSWPWLIRMRSAAGLPVGFQGAI